MFTKKKLFIAGLLCFMGYISSLAALTPVKTMKHKDGKMYEVFLNNDVKAENQTIDRVCDNTFKAAFLSAYCTQYVTGLAAFTAPCDATVKAICKRMGSITGKYLMIPATLIAVSSYMESKQRLTNAGYIDNVCNRLNKELQDTQPDNYYDGWEGSHKYKFKEKTEHVKTLPPYLEYLSV